MPVRTHPQTIGRLGVRLASAAVFALALLPPAPAAGARKSHYARVRTSKDSVVYIQIRRGQLRAAAEIAGLKAAKPVKARRSSKYGSFTYTFFPEIELPAAANKGPKVMATFQLRQSGKGRKALNSLAAIISVVHTDEEKAKWVHTLNAGADTASAPADAPMIDATTDAPPTMAVTSEIVRSGRLAVGVTLDAGRPSRRAILKDGRPVPTQISIVDADGETVASAEGTLDEFGFL